MTLKYEEQCAYFMTLLKSYMFLANGCKDSVCIKQLEYLITLVIFNILINMIVLIVE